MTFLITIGIPFIVWLVGYAMGYWEARGSYIKSLNEDISDYHRGFNEGYSYAIKEQEKGPYR